MAQLTTTLLALLVASVAAQQPGTQTPEVHPSLPSWKCTKAGGCKAVNTSVVLDSQYRWLHNVGGYTNCYRGSFQSDICTDEASCGQKCEVEGVDYSSYGITTNGSELHLSLFTKKNGAWSKSSPRVYLLANESAYDMFSLLNAEFAFDVETRDVPCGVNAALYFSEMDVSGNAGVNNKAGAKYGTGYCDAQCPVNQFVNGRANINNTLGACCNEMDIWEANSAATAYTPHTCNITGPFACTGAQCGDKGVCDRAGCDYNPYRMGSKSFYGPSANSTVDTTRKFTVVTQFLTSDNTSTGTLTEIRRLYVQDGKVIQNAKQSIPGISPTNSLTDKTCTESKKVLGGADTFASQGGMAGMGKAVGRGMVLAMSIWDDSSPAGMLWLDGVYPKDGDAKSPGVERGPCKADSGDSANIAANSPESRVVFSNIKSGEIGSTYMGK